jgi:uncharacterized protein YcbK (DUF882 family)
MRATRAQVASSAIALACALSAPTSRAAPGPATIDLERGPEGRALESPADTPGPPVDWAKRLGAVVVDNANTGMKGSVTLYRADGAVNRDALRAFSAVACDLPKATPDAKEPTEEERKRAGLDEPLDTRLVQLAVKAAYHFGAKDIVVISAYRPPARGGGGKHATHEAIDFKLRGVPAGLVAAHLRGYPRVGVGIYTHPKTQYVHLDVRDQSFHWLDASPPGRTWREAALPDKLRNSRDASYTWESDLPERAQP